MAERLFNPNLYDSEPCCVSCDDNRQPLARLDCQHTFCLICLSYLVLKHRTRGQSQSEVSCARCNRTTRLGQQILEVIGATIRQTLLPKLNSIEQTCELSSAGIEEEQYESEPISEFSLRKQRKQHNEQPPTHSHEQSIDHITPSTRYLLSKGDSPASSRPARECCVDHPLEECSFVCLTCPARLLCIKCMSQPLHHHHNIKSFEKGMELLSEQLSFRKIEVNERIDLLETRQRRLQGKKGLLQDKCNKSKMQVSEQISHLINRLKKKELELLQKCHSCYQQLEEELNDELDTISKRLFGLRKFKYDFKKLQVIEQDGEQGQALEFFSLYSRLREELEGAFADSPIKQGLKPLSFSLEPEIQLGERQLAEAVESISRINLSRISSGGGQTSCVVATPVCFAGPLGSACVSMSTSKMGNLITQFTSMNTSTEKKKVKHLRTEDNQNLRLQTEQMKSAGKLRTNLNSRFNSPQSRIGEVPLYITKFMDKHAPKARQGEDYSECNFASKTSIHNLDSSTLVAQQGNRSKMALKQTRMQRKTTNPLHSLQTQKLIFETKKSKLK